MPPRPIYDLDQLDIDFDNPLYDLDGIRRVNPQRHEMEQLTGILYVDREANGIVGFKDVTEEEFWIPGHMPGFPLMPGVILCECAAQLAGFYARKYNVVEGDYLGFGGMKEVRFRLPVFPPCRLVIMGMMSSVRARRRAQFDFQGYVDNTLVYNGTMIGVPIHRDHKIAEKGAT